MRNLISLVLISALACVALANHDVTVPYPMQEMTITVDGDLADWAGATWYALDEAYTGTAADITAASYSVVWSSTTNRLYVAVQVTDTEQNFAADYINWNGQDGIELYVDAEIDVNSYYQRHDVGQQIITGTDGAGSMWGVQIVSGATQPQVTVESMTAVVTGDDIVYEYCIIPWGYYTGFGGTTEATDREAVLAADQTIGFDLVCSTLLDGGTFAMLCNNLTGGKHSQTIKFQTWTLESAGGPALHPGDANGDNKVDINDFILLKQNYGTASGATWGMGDFNADGAVNINDFIILKQNYGWALAS